MITDLLSSTNRKWLWAILFAAGVLRGGAILMFDPPLISDDTDYDALARSIAHGDGYELEGKPTAYRTPGYPLIVGGMYALFGDTKTPVRVLQGLSDVVSCFLVFVVGKRLFSEGVGLIGAAVFAFFPIEVLYVSHLMTETIFTSIFLLVIVLALQVGRTPSRPRRDIVLGALIGVDTLIRPVVLIFPLLIFLWKSRGGIPLYTNLRSVALICIAAFLVISPWILRNYSEFHRFALTSNVGVNFWMGSHAGAGGAYSFPKENNPLIAIEDDFERSDLGIKLGLEFIVKHPLAYGVLLGKKFVRFFSPDYWLMMTMQYNPAWVSTPNAATIFAQLSATILFILHIPYVGVLFLGTFGLVCDARQDRGKIFVLRSLVLYWLLIHLIFFADARYRFPIMPVFMLASAYALAIVRANSFQRTKVRVAAFTLCCLLFIGGWIGEYVTIRLKSNYRRTEMRKDVGVALPHGAFLHNSDRREPAAGIS